MIFAGNKRRNKTCFEMLKQKNHAYFDVMVDLKI